MMRIPNRIHAETFSDNNTQACVGGKWVFARPLPFYSWRERWVLAWAVFTGKADALFWWKQ